MYLLAVVWIAMLSIMPPSHYTGAWDRVPERHRSLVQSIHVDRDSGGQSRRSTMSVHLTPRGNDGQLWHEVGHIVAYSDPKLEADWCRRFWRGGRPIGTLPSSYPVQAEAKDEGQGCPEDFADSYKEMLEHGCLGDHDRSHFMHDRVFRPGEVSACQP